MFKTGTLTVVGLALQVQFLVQYVEAFVKGNAAKREKKVTTRWMLNISSEAFAYGSPFPPGKEEKEM